MGAALVSNFNQFVEKLEYSLMDNLSPDPFSREDGLDLEPREVLSGHYVPVAPTPIKDSECLAYSQSLFKDLGLSEALVNDLNFQKAFTADLSSVPSPMKRVGWATGYALSIYGTEYTHQCPFRTGNGYGDGRALSIVEGVFAGKRWEMQLKGAGRTPYCRGADGRAVLRSSVREFLAQEHMHALGVPTTRSLCLFASRSESVMRPWYSVGSQSYEPDSMVKNPVAITTRVASSFLRVGQIELFARRVRKSSSSAKTLAELKMLAMHLIEREYRQEIDKGLPFEKQIVELAICFQKRLARLIAHWLRVGYCQGNFNSDNCHAGGLTLDYGPFGFCEVFEPAFQPWIGGGRHFSFFNQPKAAELNFIKFCQSIGELLGEDSPEKNQLDAVAEQFVSVMQSELQAIWCRKLGLVAFDDEIFQKLIFLMAETGVDYTIFFRELSSLPTEIKPLIQSFYSEPSQDLVSKWQSWLKEWRERVLIGNQKMIAEISVGMKSVNPKFTWREWLVVPAYQKAAQGDYSVIQELLRVLNNPYQEQSKEVEEKYYRLRPTKYMQSGGVSHYSCSS